MITKNNVWHKIPERRVELIHNAALEYQDSDGKWHYHDASEQSPISGTVCAERFKKIGANRIRFYKFKPDFCPDICFELSSNWFRHLKN